MLKRKNEGITLIALVITIILLLILAAVSLRLVLGDNGLIAKARLGAFTHELEAIAEKIEVERGNLAIDEYTTGEVKNLFTEKYTINADTPDTLVAAMTEAREKANKTGDVNTDKENLYYIDTKYAPKEHTYVFDLLSWTVFKIPQTKIAGTIYHYVRSGETNGTTAEGPSIEQVGEITPIEPEPEKVDYEKYIPIYTADEFKQIASGETITISEAPTEVFGTQQFEMTSEAIYKLMNDIDFGGENLTPLPEFKGIFYGDGKTLSNFNIDNTSNTTKIPIYSEDGSSETTCYSPTGLFSRVIGGTTLTEYGDYIGGKIHYLNILNAGTIKGNESVAVLVGDAAGIVIKDITIDNNTGSKTTISVEDFMNSNKHSNSKNRAGVVGVIYDKSDAISEFNNIKVKNIQFPSVVNDNDTAGIVKCVLGKTIFESCFVESLEGANTGLAHYVSKPISVYNCWAKSTQIGLTDSKTVGGLIDAIDSPEPMSIVEKDNKIDANIYNCGLINVNFIERNNDMRGDIGGIVGYSTNSLKFENINVEISDILQGSNVGGVIAILYEDNSDGIQFENIKLNIGTIKSSGNSGGVAGYIYNNGESVILNKIQNINSVIYSSSSTGGIVGCTDAKCNIQMSNMEIKNVTVVSNGSHAGSIIGGLEGNSDSTVKIKNSIIEDVTINGKNEIGGIIGFSKAENIIEKCNISNVTLGPKMNENGEIMDIPNLPGIKYINECDTAGGIIGFSYYGTSLMDCNIKNINIDNLNRSYELGGIVGNVYTKNFLITNSNIEEIKIQNFKCDKVGGLTSFVGGGNIEIQGNIKNIKISTTNYSYGNASAGLVRESYSSAYSTSIDEGTQISDIEVIGNFDYIGGLFSHLSGTLNIDKNVNISNITIDNNYKSGEIAGIVRIAGNIAIDDSKISNINVKNAGINTAGLVYCTNESNKSHITNSQIDNIQVNVTNEIKSNTGYEHIAGVIASCYSELTLKDNDFSDITVTTESSNCGVGGIICSGKVNMDGGNVNNITVDTKLIGNYSTYCFFGGIISYLGGGTGISNVKVDTINITSNGNTGGIVGMANSNIDHVNAENINITSNGIFVGGFVGMGKTNIANSEINEATIIHDFSVQSSYVGGLVGMSEGNIESITADTINVTSNANFIGGFVGISKANITDSTINSATIIQDSSVQDSWIGGLVGVSESNIESITANTINITSSGNTGGIVGMSRGNIESITADTINVTGNKFIGGLIGFSSIGNKIYDINAINVTAKNKCGNLNTNIPLNCCTGGVIGHSDSELEKITLKDSYVINGITVGGIVGFESNVTMTDLKIEGVEIKTDSEKTIYSAGGIVGHGANSGSLTNCTSDRLTISNAEFAGGIAGIAVPNIHDSNVINSTISAINTNVGYVISNAYTGGYAGGIIGASGMYMRLDLNNDKVQGTTVTGGTVSGEIYGAGIYYPDDYDEELRGPKKVDSVVDCTFTN